MKIDLPITIKPLVGFGDILLGSSKEKIFDSLGQPESTSSDEWPDDTISESWAYPALGVVLNFDSDTNYRLSTITITSDTAELDNIKPIGLNISALIEAIPSIVLDEDIDGAAKDYVDPEREISFWTMNNIVEHVTLFPEYSKTTDEPLWPVI